MCDVSPYVQQHDDADVHRADAMTVSPAAEAPRSGTNPMTRRGESTAMTTLVVADARKPSELSSNASGRRMPSGRTRSEEVRAGGSDGRRAKVTVKDSVQLLISLSKPPRRKGDAHD